MFFLNNRASISYKEENQIKIQGNTVNAQCEEIIKLFFSEKNRIKNIEYTTVSKPHPAQSCWTETRGLFHDHISGSCRGSGNPSLVNRDDHH